MPDHLLRILLLLLAGNGSVLLCAQQATVDLPDPALEPQPKLIVLAGIAPQLSYDYFRTFFLAAERSWGPYRHAGLQFSQYLTNNNEYYDLISTAKLSYEVSIYSKFFMHGRLSGRRSNFYYGPQIRFGLRQLERYNYPNPPLNYQQHTTKFLFCLGAQYRLGHAILDWTLPIGAEISRLRQEGTVHPSTTRLCVIPSIALGFRL